MIALPLTMLGGWEMAVNAAAGFACSFDAGSSGRDWSPSGIWCIDQRVPSVSIMSDTSSPYMG